MFITFRPFPGELLLSAVHFAVFKAVAKCLHCLGSDCSLQWLNALSEQIQVLLLQQWQYLQGKRIQRGPKWNRNQRRTQGGPKYLFVLSLGLSLRNVSSSCKCLSFIRRHVKGVAALLHSFLPYSTEGGRWSASRPSCCTTRKISGTHFIRSPFGFRYSAGYGEKTLNDTGIWNLNLPARELFAVLTTLSRSVLSVLK